MNHHAPGYLHPNGYYYPYPHIPQYPPYTHIPPMPQYAGPPPQGYPRYAGGPTQNSVPPNPRTRSQPQQPPAQEPSKYSARFFRTPKQKPAYTSSHESTIRMPRSASTPRGSTNPGFEQYPAQQQRTTMPKPKASDKLPRRAPSAGASPHTASRGRDPNLKSPRTSPFDLQNQLRAAEQYLDGIQEDVLGTEGVENLYGLRDEVEGLERRLATHGLAFKNAEPTSRLSIARLEEMRQNLISWTDRLREKKPKLEALRRKLNRESNDEWGRASETCKELARQLSAAKEAEAQAQARAQAEANRTRGRSTSTGSTDSRYVRYAAPPSRSTKPSRARRQSTGQFGG